MHGRGIAFPGYCLACLAVVVALCPPAVAQPPMEQAPPPGNGASVTPPPMAEGETAVPPGPAVKPGTLQPATPGAAKAESGPATESGPAKRAPRMAHTGANLVTLYGLSAGCVIAGLLLWGLSRRQLRAAA